MNNSEERRQESRETIREKEGYRVEKMRKE